MATYTWVGTTSNWDTAANWDAVAVPSSTIDVLFNNANPCSAAGTDACRNLTYANANPSISLGGTFNVYGNFTLFAGASFTGNNSLTFSSTSTGQTITTAGISTIGSMTFNGVGGGWTLQDNLTTAGLITVTNGAFFSNDKNINADAIFSANSNVRTVSLGSSVITLTDTALPWDFSTITNISFGSGTSTIKLTGGTSSDKIFKGGGLPYYNFYNATTSTGKVILQGSNTFNNFKCDAGRTNQFTAGTTTTVSSMNVNGSSGNLTVLQSSAGSYNLVSAGANINFYYCNISNCHASGATFTAYNSIDSGGNTGITFVSSSNSVNAWNTNPIDTFLLSSDGSINITSLGKSIDITANDVPATNPCFLAYLPSTVTNKTGNGTAYAFGTDALTKVFDTGNNLNTNGGIFTAPTTGKYFLKAQIAITGCTIATTFILTISTTARAYQKTIIRTAVASDGYIDIDTIADMTAGDLALASITVSGEAADTDDILGSATLVSFWCGEKVE